MCFLRQLLSLWIFSQRCIYNVIIQFDVSLLILCSSISYKERKRSSVQSTRAEILG